MFLSSKCLLDDPSFLTLNERHIFYPEHFHLYSSSVEESNGYQTDIKGRDNLKQLSRSPEMQYFDPLPFHFLSILCLSTTPPSAVAS